MVRESSDAVLRGIALAALVATIALLAGCGGDDGSDSPATESGSAQAGTEQTGGPPNVKDFGEEAGPEDREAASATVQGFLRAQANGNSATACSLMSTSVKENLELFLEGAASESEKNSCPELVKALRTQVPEKRLTQAKQIEVTGVRIEGDRGYVLYRDPGGTESAFAVVREDSTWKAGAIAGQPLP